MAQVQAQTPKRFTFDGGAATYVGTALLAGLITAVTLTICYPFAIVLMQRWKAKHSYIDGRRLVFTGSAIGLWGNWIKWLLLCIITLGIYSFWVVPRLLRWIWEHTEFEPMAAAFPAQGQMPYGSMQQFPPVGPPAPQYPATAPVQQQYGGPTQ
ncbi:MAG TPA: DUF898 family protein [Actinocrinis sp.]|nr:DUF898 family protein [Actinocrinis sp.]